MSALYQNHCAIPGFLKRHRYWLQRFADAATDAGKAKRRTALHKSMQDLALEGLHTVRELFTEHLNDMYARKYPGAKITPLYTSDAAQVLTRLQAVSCGGSLDGYIGPATVYGMFREEEDKSKVFGHIVTLSWIEPAADSAPTCT